jgi:hypothetical protein
MIKRALLYAFVGLASTLSAQEVKVEANPKDIKIGEQVQYKISVKGTPEDRIVFPDGQTFSPLEMVRTEPTDTLKDKGTYRLVKTYYLTQFDEGQYTIPPQRVVVNSKDFITDSIRVAVRNIAIDTLQRPLYDIKPIAEVGRPARSLWWLWVLGGAAIGAIVGGLLYIFVFRKKKLSDVFKKKQLPPFERAIQDLRELQQSRYLMESQHKEYYSRLTDIVKEYLEDEVHILAKESTTDELLAKITLLQEKGKLYLAPETIQNLKRVLQTADLVKFAKSKPSDNNAEYDRETIENVVIKTKEAIPVVSPSGATVQQQSFLELLAEQKRKYRKRAKKVVIIVCSVMLLLGVGAAVVGYYYANQLIGTQLLELNARKWVTSDYGYPVTQLSTPEVLTRRQIGNGNLLGADVDKEYCFDFGSINSELYIMTDVITFKAQGDDKPLNLNPQQVNELLLSQLDKAGAKNITTLQEEVTLPSGAKGIRVYGKMQVLDEKTKQPFEAGYESLSFAENGALQQLLITYIDKPAAQPIVQRVIGSIVFKTE